MPKAKYKSPFGRYVKRANILVDDKSAQPFIFSGKDIFNLFVLFNNGRRSVKVATTANITLSGEQTIDGVLTASSRILVKDQTATDENGIYITDASTWVRSTDSDTWEKLVSAFTIIEEGATQKDTPWLCKADEGGTLGVTSVEWIAFPGTGGGGGDVATDVIWDAVGDIAVGTGANTAAVLSIGTARQLLQVNAGATNIEYTSDIGAATTKATNRIIELINAPASTQLGRFTGDPRMESLVALTYTGAQNGIGDQTLKITAVTSGGAYFHATSANGLTAGLKMTDNSVDSSVFATGANISIAAGTSGLIYLTTSAGTGLTMSAARAIKFDAYGGGTITGTIAYILAEDSSGNIIEEPISSVRGETSKTIIIESPGSAEDISLFFTNIAVTVTEMRAVLVGSSTPSVTWTIRHGTDRSATGAEVVTSGTTTTSVTTGSDVTAFNDATIVADSFVWLETTAQSGTVTELMITVFYTQD